MRLPFELPLFLLPAFLLTSEIILISASTTRPPEELNIHASSKKPRSPSTKFTLTQCAKQCRAEFFQYCHTREPGSKGDSNSFRRCMCVDRSGAQYMEHCARRCNGGSGEAFPEQVGEIRAWWSSWCGKHEPTATTISIPQPSAPVGLEKEGDVDNETSKIPGISLINTDGDPEHELHTPTPSSKPETVPDGEAKSHGASVYAAGASVTFASAFLFLSYVMFMRRSKYARRRGVLAWLRLRLLERGYRGGGGGAGLPRSRTTAMRMRVTNGRTAVVGNPRWLNKTMPALPQSRNVNIGVGGEIQNETAYTGPTAGFLSRFIDGQKQAGPGGLSRGGMLGWKHERRKSHRYSQGWLNAAKKYSDEAEEEDEKVQDYFRSKGIARSGKDTGLSSTDNGTTGLQQISHNNSESHEDVEEKRYGEGGLNVREQHEEADTVGGGSRQQQLEPVDEDEEDIDGLIESTDTAHTNGYLQQDIDKENDDSDEDRNERTGRVKTTYTSTRRDIAGSDRSTSPDGAYSAIADISATPHLDGGQWDSWSGVEGTQINATGGLTRASPVPYERGYGNGGLTFDEVELVEGDDVYGWTATARSDVHSLQFPASYSTINAEGGPNTQASSATGYGPILPVIEPDPQHGKKGVEHMNQQQSSKAKSKWRLSGKVAKGFLGRKGKRSGESGSGDLGRGAYGSL